MKKRIISMLMVLAIAICMFPSYAFAEEHGGISVGSPSQSYTMSISSTDKSGQDITLWNHTEVIMRSLPNTSSTKVHTLYVGDTVHVITWQVSPTPTNGHYWANIYHKHSSTGAFYSGYSANDLLS